MEKGLTKKWYDVAMEYALYAIVIFLPVIFDPAFYTIFSAPKLFILRIFTLLIIGLWIWKTLRERKFTYVKTPLNIALVFMGAAAVLSTVFSVNFWTSLHGTEGRFVGLLTTLNFLLLSFFAINILTDSKKIIRLLSISVAVASALALYGITQYFGTFQEFFDWNQDPALRVFGTVGHGNHFGAYLGMHLIVGIFLIPHIKRRPIFVAGLTAQAFCLFLTGSRGAIIATFLAFLITGMVVLIKEQKFSMKKMLLGILIVAAIFVSVVTIFRNEFSKIPAASRSLQAIQLMSEGKIPDRFSWWISALEMAKDKPLLGYGLSTFRDVYNQYRRSDYVTLEQNDMQDMITPEAAHNEFLNITATQGIVGLAAYVALIFMVLSRILQSNWKNQKELAGLFGAILLYLIQAFVSFGVITTLTFFYLFLGIGMALAKAKKTPSETPLSRPSKIIITILGVLMLGEGFSISTNEARAEIEYKSALLTSSKGNKQQALEHFTAAINLKPQEVAYHQGLADFTLKLPGKDMIRRAALSYENALKINDLHPSTWYNLGLARLELYKLTQSEQHYDQAGKDFDQAIIRAPNNPLYPYQIGQTYMVFAKEDARRKALEYLNQALQIRPNYRDAQVRIDQLKTVLNAT